MFVFNVRVNFPYFRMNFLLTADALAAELVKNSHEQLRALLRETFILSGHTTCQTSNVVYLIECNKCNHQYIGETKNPNQHRSDINGGQKNIPTVRHFINCGVKHLK